MQAGYCDYISLVVSIVKASTYIKMISKKCISRNSNLIMFHSSRLIHWHQNRIQLMVDDDLTKHRSDITNVIVEIENSVDVRLHLGEFWHGDRRDGGDQWFITSCYETMSCLFGVHVEDSHCSERCRRDDVFWQNIGKGDYLVAFCCEFVYGISEVARDRRMKQVLWILKDDSKPLWCGWTNRLPRNRECRIIEDPAVKLYDTLYQIPSITDVVSDRSDRGMNTETTSSPGLRLSSGWEPIGGRLETYKTTAHSRQS